MIIHFILFIDLFYFWGGINAVQTILLKLNLFFLIRFFTNYKKYLKITPF